MSQAATLPRPGAGGPPAQGGATPALGFGAAAQQSESYKWWVLVTVVFGAFVSILDNTIVNTAVPKIQAVFGSDLHTISYVATGYTLAAGIVVPATGFLANRFGIKRIYLWSLTLFTIGSALCGLAWDTSSLIFFRVLQGAGGAALFPLSFAILFSTFPPSERGRANGFFGIPVLFAPAIGPTLGGFIVQYVDWRWIFYVNVPIGIAGVLLGRAILRESPPRPELRFDLRGFLIVGTGLGILLYGLSNLAYDGLGSTTTVSGPIVIALVLLAIWVPVELRTRQPLLDLRLFARRNYLFGNVMTLLGTIGIFGPAFLLPQYLQNLRGLDPYPAGLLLFTSGVGTVLGTILAGQFYNRFGARTLIVVGSSITVITSIQLMQWSTLTSSYSDLPWILLLRGVGLPLFLQSANTSALNGIEGHALPGATTLNVVGRNAIASLAIAALTNVLQTQRIVHQAHLASRITSNDLSTTGMIGAMAARLVAAGATQAQANAQALFQVYGQVARLATTLAYRDIYLITAVVTAPVILLAFLIQAPKAGGTPGGPGGGRPPAGPE